MNELLPIDLHFDLHLTPQLPERLVFEQINTGTQNLVYFLKEMFQD